MPSRIEDYALIGDCQTAALVARDGSIDWLCLPRFDSGACFAALLGGPEHGRWKVAPAGEVRKVRRRYRDGTLVLETEFETDDGVVAVIDFMPRRSERPDLVRIVEGRRGTVPVRMELILRFDYGSIVPWVRRYDGGISAIAGPDAVEVRGPGLRGEGLETVADLVVAEGQRVPFVLTWHRSYQEPPAPIDPEEALGETESWWREWSDRCVEVHPWREAVVRSLITLKAMTYAPTGGIVAAATTSLPEQIGGSRNWDYRFCWLRDASFTLSALLRAGYLDEARDWREWLLRAVAGDPAKLQIMYGIRGERRLTEMELPWLPGYEGSAPVRIGNAASEQLQLDVYGELAGALFQATEAGLKPSEDGWQRVATPLYDFLESHWQEPDDGIWEVRGPRKQYTHSKVMAWVALDRAVRIIEQFHMDGPVDRWRATRDAIHDQACRLGFDPKLGAFVQSYGSDRLDASLLMIPLVGFLPVTDPRVAGTVAAIERDLTVDGLVVRYRSDPDADGLPPGEGTFLPCSFWLADNLALLGRHDDARRLFEHLLSLRNDVGLLSEEYDTKAGRLVGNFPQAFSHISLVNTAFSLSGRGPGSRPGRA